MPRYQQAFLAYDQRKGMRNALVLWDRLSSLCLWGNQGRPIKQNFLSVKDRCTCSLILTTSNGATHIRETTPADAPATKSSSIAETWELGKNFGRPRGQTLVTRRESRF